ncbi:MAG: TonB-dependent receptor [Ichthyobacteriaceae bacterium]|nr:TonB-dependent receptor [Ichthyobacteriaceae bacterium]
MKNFLLGLLFFLVAHNTNAQLKYTISGTIQDFSTGEDLIGVNIAIKELPTSGATTNTYGFYSISLKKDVYNVLFSYLGYKTITKQIDLSKNTRINISLKPDAESLSEVVVSATRDNDNVVSTSVGVSKLSIKDIETVPVLFGEKDIMKTIQLLPGVKPAGDGNAGFYVRGGSADQNLILLDGAPVYNASHLMGFFSVFNSTAIKDVKLYKGSMPAEYGGRLASVMDVVMNEGNNKEFKADGGIGLISSKLTIEGPIQKDKSSFIISGRRTYADLFLMLVDDEKISSSTLYFYDLNVKANMKISDNDRVFLSGYFGRDVLGVADKFGFNWGNTTGTIRWNHIANDKLFSNTSLIFSNYNYLIEISNNNIMFNISSQIQDWNFKQHFDYYMNENNSIKFGLNVINHTFKPGDFEAETDDLSSINIEPKYSLESSAYVSNTHKIFEKLTLNYGLRFSNFTQYGPGEIMYWDKEGNLIHTKNFNKNEVVVSYNRWAPRISGTFIVNDNSSIKSSYARSFQFLHMLSNSSSSSPTDTWMPSSNNIKPSESNQIALGYFRNLKDNKWEFSTEIYYKYMTNIIDYRTGAQTMLNNEVESELLNGDGRAYGIEFLLKKKAGKFSGWISYTLSKSEKLFDEINNGAWFSAKQDRIHDFSIVGTYKFTERLSLSGTWVYFTGNAITFPAGKFSNNGFMVPLYSERNGYRMPDYHRLDLGLTLKNKKYKYVLNPKTGEKVKIKDPFQSSWNFSLYNAYARENAYSISFQEDPDNPGHTQAVQIALFKIVPSISYNFSF